MTARPIIRYGIAKCAACNTNLTGSAITVAFETNKGELLVLDVAEVLVDSVIDAFRQAQKQAHRVAAPAVDRYANFIVPQTWEVKVQGGYDGLIVTLDKETPGSMVFGMNAATSVEFSSGLMNTAIAYENSRRSVDTTKLN